MRRERWAETSSGTQIFDFQHFKPGLWELRQNYPQSTKKRASQDFSLQQRDLVKCLGSINLRSA